MAWPFLYVVGFIYIVETSQYAVAALIWLCCGVIAFGVSGIAAALYLTSRIRRAKYMR